MRATAFLSMMTVMLAGCGGSTRGSLEGAGGAAAQRTALSDGATPCPALPCPSGESVNPTTCRCAQPTSCRGAGNYEAGKEGSYLPCCEGLQEVEQLQSATQGDNLEHICAPAIGVRKYACVAGRCGDGRCEPAESVPCGCVQDCPSAAWGPDSGM
ncbi:MAG TPA: hypothetical protein VH062_06240 [Polyangiaceae bacterium]|nr:hypothetical protein [Polyangiaceae bacterium]